MKKLLLSMLMLLMSFMLFSPSAYASGDPGFTVYAFTASDTTHNLPDDLDLSKTIIFVGGLKIYEYGVELYPYDDEINDWPVVDLRLDEYATDGIFRISNWPSEENAEFNSSTHPHAPSGLLNSIGLDIVIIVSDNPDSFTAWGYQMHTEPEQGTNEAYFYDVLNNDPTRITVYSNGRLSFYNGDPGVGFIVSYGHDAYGFYFSIHDAVVRDVIGLRMDYSEVDNTFEYSNVIIIAAESSSEAPDTTGWTQDGTYYKLDDPTPASGESITVTSPFGNPLEYRLIISGNTIQDWTVAPSTFQVTMRIEMVGVGDFNHYLEITGDNYEDSFGPYLDPINYEGFEIRTSSLEVLPSGWFENNGYWFAEDPTPSPGETKTLVSPFGTPIEYRLRNGETVVKNWTAAPSSIDITLRVEFIALGDFNFYIDIIGVEFTDTLGPYMNSDVFINGFEVRTNEPFVDASPIIEGQQYFTVSYHQPVTETSIRSNIYAWDEVDGNLTSSIQLVSDGYTPNKNTVGTYEVKYRVTDSSNNTAYLTVYVMVIDQIAPVFNFGNDVIYQSYKTLRTFTSTVVISDGHDGNVNATVSEDTYTANYNIIGEYHITYSATDASGNTATMTRTVIVVDDVPPVITGPTVITKSYNTILTTAQIMAQLTALDEIDGDVSGSFMVMSSTYGGKSNVPGTYTIVFRAIDASGNSAQRSVTIIVTDNIPPIWYATNNFLITLDQAVQLSTNQIINTLQLSGFITDTQASNLYVVSDEYQQSQDIGTYNLVFGITGQSETLTVTLVVYNLSLEEPGMYTVSFNSNGGSFVPSISTDGTPVSAPTAPTRTGYVFSGWYTDEALTTLYLFASEVTADMTLYAKWTLAGGGTTPPPVTSEGLTTLQIVGIALGGLIVLSILSAALSPKKFGGRRR